MDSEGEECSTKSLKDPFETKWHLRWGLHVLESIVIISSCCREHSSQITGDELFLCNLSLTSS